MTFTRNSIRLDAEAEIERICGALKIAAQREFRKRGSVVGVSGGIDSATTLALCARALGPNAVTAVLMPDRDSEPETEALSRMTAARFGVETVLEDMTESLAGLGCYRRRDEAIRAAAPEFDPEAGDRAKIVLPDLASGKMNVFSVVIVKPDGTESARRLPLREYLQIVAASNFKQRSRMAMLYYHAEARNYMVAGTANRNEHEQGFFVKYGDGGVDIRPIAHLLKTQVYQLAEALGVPREIINRTPTTDTYSASSSQEEFFFRLPFETMDVMWHGRDCGAPAEEIAEAAGVDVEQYQRFCGDFDQKKKATEYLRKNPLTVNGPEEMTEY